jgi:antitoxin component of MazEF toxin-antitoxin module
MELRKITRSGRSLAFLIPASLVRSMNIKQGEYWKVDQVGLDTICFRRIDGNKRNTPK